MLDPALYPYLKDFLYIREATVTNWVDGDTVDMVVDQGFGDSKKWRFRLLEINCPESDTPEGPAATEYSKTLVPVGSEVIIRSIKEFKKDSFGRYLVEIYHGDTSDPSTWVTVAYANGEILASGHAVPYVRKRYDS